ncbi:DUF6283 family protein [Streptomyces sp. NPDC096538]|uniref:DUF6283 family protein n=1 Tax=Streptomyces sp. NPDC096538 TaxID=3155427 RepID=UPI00332E0148
MPVRRWGATLRSWSLGHIGRLPSSLRPPASRSYESCPCRRNVPAGIWTSEEYTKLRCYDADTPDQCSKPDEESCGRRGAEEDVTGDTYSTTARYVVASILPTSTAGRGASPSWHPASQHKRASQHCQHRPDGRNQPSNAQGLWISPGRDAEGVPSRMIL